MDPARLRPALQDALEFAEAGARLSFSNPQNYDETLARGSTGSA
jgi:hypothetical protein